MYQNSEALCLHVIDFSETSQIARLFSRRHGLLGVIAKGIKRGKQTAASPLGGPLEMLALGQAVFAPGRGGGELATLSGWEVLNHRQQMRRHLPTFYAGATLADVTMALLALADPHPELFDELVVALDLLSRGPIARVAAAYIKAALKETGYLPILDRCVICGSAVGANTVRFTARAGGIICPDCPTPGPTMALPGLVVVALARLPSPRAMLDAPMVRPADPQALFQALQLLFSQVESNADHVLKTRSLLRIISGCSDAGAPRRPSRKPPPEQTARSGLTSELNSATDPENQNSEPAW